MSGRRISALIACGMMLVALTMAGLHFQLEDNLDRFLIVASLQSVFYAMGVWLCWTGGVSRGGVLAIAVLAIAMRAPTLVAPPYLSNDIYRYVWDGQVEAAGFNPYLYAPSDPKLEALRDHDIYPQIASKYAPTIYPPVAEGLFLLLTRVSASVAAMKLAMVSFEAITFAFEFSAQLGEVIDLPVVGDPDGARFIAHRHAAEWRQVEDGKTTAAQSDVGSVGEPPVPDSGIVRSAMRLYTRHAYQRFAIATIHHSADAAHALSSIPFEPLPGLGVRRSLL